MKCIQLKRYLVLVTTFSLVFLNCFALSTQNTSNDPFTLKQIQSIPTNNSRGWINFNMDGQNYFAVAEFSKGYPKGQRDINSTIYRWNGKQLVQFQKILTHGARNWQYTTIDGQHYLMIANIQSDVGGKIIYNVNSSLYRWNGKQFVLYQNIPTVGISNLIFFDINRQHYLALAGQEDQQNQTKGETVSAIYQWDGKKFRRFQHLTTQGASAWEFMNVEGNKLLAVCNVNGNTSTIYSWNGQKFVPFQTLSTADSRDMKYFVIGKKQYLVVASVNSNPILYQWNGKQFFSYQQFNLRNVRNWNYFTYQGKDYLLATTFAHTTDKNAKFKAILYQFDGSQFKEIKQIATNGVGQTIYFNIDNKGYLLFNHIFSNTIVYALT